MYDRVEVTWRDITSYSGWHTHSKTDKIVMSEDCTVCQIGYLYEEDENQIVLIDSYFTSKDTLGAITRIPKGCIIARQVLVDKK